MVCYILINTFRDISSWKYIYFTDSALFSLFIAFLCFVSREVFIEIYQTISFSWSDSGDLSSGTILIKLEQSNTLIMIGLNLVKIVPLTKETPSNDATSNTSSNSFSIKSYHPTVVNNSIKVYTLLKPGSHSTVSNDSIF